MAIRKAIFVDANGDYEESTGMYETSDFVSTSAGVADADKPIKLDASGLIDNSMIDGASLSSEIDHGSVAGLLDDDHTQYLALDSNLGSRGGVQTITGDLRVQDPATATSIANKQYVDAVAEGLAPKQAVRVATTAAQTLSTDFEDGDTIDGIVLATGDRVLIKDQAAPAENGIYIVQATGAPVRSTDMDSDSPINEINGAYVPVQAGVENEGKFFVQTQVLGPGDLDVQPINFTFFNAVASGVSGGDGITFVSGVVSVDLQTGGGLKIDAAQLAVEPADIIGIGLIESPDDAIAIDFADPSVLADLDGTNANKTIKASDLYASASPTGGANLIGVEDASAYYAGSHLEDILDELEAQIGGLTSSTFAFTEDNVLADNDAIYSALDKLDLKFGDLASTAASEGASLVGIEDLGGNYTATTVEGALSEVAGRVSTNESDIVTLFNSLDRDEATAGEAISAGDLLYFSANDTVSIYSDISVARRAVGVALSSASASATVQYARWDEVVSGALTAATAGERIYWDGTDLTTTIPSTSGQYVWQVGVAKNATDMLATVEFIKKNS